MADRSQDRVLTLYSNWNNTPVDNVTLLPQSGSYREYYRIQYADKSVIGVYNADKKENVAFLTFSKHFAAKNLSVPRVLAEDIERDVYLLDDLGNTTLFDYLQEARQKGAFPDEVISVYKNVLEDLADFQIHGNHELDYSVCYPRAAFDRQSMLWDLWYFKYYFLKLAKIPFDEQLLENDFHRLIDFLLIPEDNYFLYRDFQSRNIMLHDEKLFYIDYQGGRRGALYYDVASLLYDSKANIPIEVRTRLLDHYMDVIHGHQPVDREAFYSYFYGFALIRILQAMGAYGFRGFYEKKEHFLQSIPYALNNLDHLIKTANYPVKLLSLMDTLKRMIDSPDLRKIGNKPAHNSSLAVRISSFSYQDGMPLDDSGKADGFVFDCRSVHNPGRYEEYHHLTGKDKELKDMFLRESLMTDFLQDVYSMVDRSVEKYKERKAKEIKVNFGSHNGRHRSVYCAESLKSHLKEIYKLEISTCHFALEKKESKQNDLYETC